MMERMTREQMERWVAALRSGKYQQGKGRLCRMSGNRATWCCLGVYLDVNMDDDWYATYGDNVHRTKDITGYRYGDPGGEFTMPPHTIARSIDGAIKTDLPIGACSRLADMNDARYVARDGGRSWDFDAIADWIEENFQDA